MLKQSNKYIYSQVCQSIMFAVSLYELVLLCVKNKVLINTKIKIQKHYTKYYSAFWFGSQQIHHNEKRFELFLRLQLLLIYFFVTYFFLCLISVQFYKVVRAFKCVTIGAESANKMWVQLASFDSVALLLVPLLVVCINLKISTDIIQTRICRLTN